MSKDQTANLKVDKIIDCVGDLCPMPIYKASMALKTIDDGQVVKVLCSDPGAARDFPAFAKQGGHSLIMVDESKDLQVFFIKKRGAR